MKADKRQINSRLRNAEKRQRSIVKLPLLVTMVVAIVWFGQTLANDGPKVDGITTLTSFNASSMQLPESITVDSSGNLYLSMSPLREIWKLDADGNFMEVVASFALEPGLFGVSGLRFGPDGNLYVAIGSTNTDMNGVWKIAPGGEKERIAGTGNIMVANDLAVSPDGTLYITDSAMGAVWRYSPGGQAEVWTQHESLEGTGAFGIGVPIGANGIVLVPGEQTGTIRAVIVANTEKGQIVRVPVLPDGSAGEPEIVIAAPAALFGLDGITADAKGNIYAAVNAGHKIVRISPDGSELIELAAGTPLDFPTSLVFGSGTEQNTLFISNFSVIHFLSDPPMPEDANPAVIALSVEP